MRPNQRLSGKSIEQDGARIRVLIGGQYAPPAASGQVFNKIIVTHATGAAQFFEPTDAGWDLAAAACTPWCSMQSPPAVYSQPHTLPAQVMYLGAGSTSTIHEATLTIGASCYVREVRIDIDANDASDHAGLVGPDAGESWANTLSITVDQAGAGNAVGVLLQDGKLDIEGSTIAATSAGAGDAYGLYATGTGDIDIIHCRVSGQAASGDGYGILEDPGGGVLYMEDGWLYGSTQSAAGLGGYGPGSFSVGDEISSGAVSVTSSSGTAIGGLTVGNWYAIEAAGGPWNWCEADPSRYVRYFDVNDGSGWYGGPKHYETPHDTSVSMVLPPWGAHIECANNCTEVNSLKSYRIYFQASGTSISFRCSDDNYPDNTGSLGWKLSDAIYTPGAPILVDTRLVTSGGVRLYPVVGEPALGERAVWDTLNWQVRHTNDIDDAAGIHHTLAALDARYSPHDEVTVSDTSTVNLTISGQALSADVIPGGIKLDDLAAPDDNTDLNASTAKHGLLPKLDNDASHFLNGQGGWTTPAAGAVDASDVTYTPAVAADWDTDTDPGNVDGALDQLAERVDDLEAAGPGGSLTVEEADGTPSVDNVTTIKVTNGTLTDDGAGVVTLDFGSAATDGSAIHDNVDGEINAIAEKATPADDDLLLIEDSAASYAKKKVKVSNLPAGTSGGGGAGENLFLFGFVH